MARSPDSFVRSVRVRVALRVALLTLSVPIAATAQTCIDVTAVAPSGCRARFGLAPDSATVEDPLCGMAPANCPGGGPNDLSVPFSDPADPVTFDLSELCDGGCVTTVRIGYACQVPVSRWTAFDSAGVLVDQAIRPSTGAPQWVQLDGECIKTVTVEAAELCILALCYVCDTALDVEVIEPAVELTPNEGVVAGLGGFLLVPTGEDSEGKPEAVDLTLAAVVDSRLRGETGVGGWSFAAVAENGLALVGATTEGTAAAPEPDGLFRDGFQHAEIVERPDGSTALLSALILAFDGSSALPPRGRSFVLEISAVLSVDVWEHAFAAGEPQDETGASAPPRATLRILRPDEEGIAGSGDPVRTLLTVGGAPVSPSVVHYGFVPTRVALFVRGDANGDGTVEMADAIRILGHLFLGTADLACEDAADSNDNGEVEIADAVRILGWQFLGAAPPAAPFPGCGMDLTGDALTCADPACP